MRNTFRIIAIAFFVTFYSCSEEFLELDPKGTELETNFYQNEEQLFQGLVATYDVLQWGGTNGEWTMKLGLLNAASDDTHAGGSDASDQPNWVAWDVFNLDPFLGPQQGLWNKSYAGIYRANLILEKIAEAEGISEQFVARTIAEVKFLRAYFYFDLVRFFNNAPLITTVLTGDELYNQVQASPAEIYAQIEQDLRDATGTFELPATLPADELGRVTRGAATALLGKVILTQNDESRMDEAAALFEEVINSGLYDLEDDFASIFSTDNEFGKESVFEIQHSGAQRGGWGNFVNGTEGNYNVQFFGMRDYVGPTFDVGWSFCPVSEDLVEALSNDPRYDATIIDGNQLRADGASYTEGYQNTDYFIRKYAGLQTDRAIDGEPALNWNNNIVEIRYADVLLMAAEAHARSGNDAAARDFLNQVRRRVLLQSVTSASGQLLLDVIYRERRLELATEGHRFFDLVRTGNASEVLSDRGYISGVHEVLPIPQKEIDIAEGNLVQNNGY